MSSLNNFSVSDPSFTIYCPGILSGSHSLSYSEYDSGTGAWLDTCGEPRSEVNTCHQRHEEDPQISINLGE